MSGKVLNNNVEGQYWKLYLYKNGERIALSETSFNTEYNGTDTEYTVHFSYSLTLNVDDEIYFGTYAADGAIDGSTAMTNQFNIKAIVVGSETEGVYLYRNYAIEPVGQFDTATIYNLPLSPKRLIMNNMPLISVSGWMKSDEQLQFVSSERDAAVYSQMAYEDSIVYEDGNEDFVTPLFIPANITFESIHNYENFSNLVANKHKYFNVWDSDREQTFQGWIKTLDISAGMSQAQTVELILKTI